MSARDPDALPTETTPEGDESLIPVCGPSTRATDLTVAPMRPRKAQKSLDIGLLDNCTRNQTDLF
ncbi:hypothetical protein [Mesorhizobium sp.]|uniref:hypothetical protein n=1 Tax=Mesorhizobium sp. TaxID=1871066 RepID=UPI000FE8FD8D|nr:hypothetical protein [Mesorhizobium sp.]TGQ61946.1 hypothetical protein EN848_32930 [bacterium M00.F.Ca.ET.205.01.1.1]TGU45232.1 hypothetical protein EN795_34160 [bacterium M00.F.Ca.ET.152.01.1.1]TGV30201.1 hypothetical protein EN829_037705 [Mesorhizobium sp. M00.F.Ca.ET.186.01.1.1]TGZ38613.1 hypothetical protein EN805_32915 [bacterium M00.F.Ca.ET.162.01.1.1]RWA58212.1 MAG: hypothetical protein EOQ29_34970 [Mesorhizobium sp.]